MLVKVLIRTIKKHSWWLEESTITHQVAEWAWRGFVESSRHFDRRYLTLGVFIYHQDFVSEFTPREEKIEQFSFALKRYAANRNYLAKKMKPWQKRIRVLTKYGYQIVNQLPRLSRRELSRGYQYLMVNYNQSGSFSIFPECVDPFTEDVLPKILKQQVPAASSTALNNLAAVMSVPLVLSFMQKERIELLSGARKIVDRPSSLESQAQKLAGKYFWTATHYGAAPVKTTKEFERDLKSLLCEKTPRAITQELQSLLGSIKRLKAQKKALVKKYRLDKQLRLTFSLIGELGYWIDQRKLYALQSTFIIYRLLEHLEQRLHVASKLLAYATSEELTAWIASDHKVVPTKTLKERRKFSVYLVRRLAPGKARAEFITGAEARAIYRAMRTVKKVKEFKGTVAYAAKKTIRGTVSLVLNTSTDKFKPGNILVTSMTRPDFFPLMRQAKAIITDEGGLTCHAAIVARELGVTCLIGTKIATKVLKDGDRVEVDAGRGLVRKI